FWCISGIDNIGIKELTQELINLTLSNTVRKELVNLSKYIISIRPNKINQQNQKEKENNNDNSKLINKRDIPCMNILELELLIERYFGKDISKESKKGIIKELHELGFILDYSKWELNKIIYDPQWLADLF